MIEILKFPAQRLPPKLAAILARSSGFSEEVMATVRDILADVRDRGDDAVGEYTQRFDGVKVEAGKFRVSSTELAAAAAQMDPELTKALEEARDNVRRFHQRQLQDSWFLEDGDGVILGKKVTPIARVGICVPGGQAPLISTLLMTAVPAQVAGVEEICAVSPPRYGGCPHPDILGAAHLLGLNEIYGIGGAQAVAALAYGTESVAAVDKIVGPGNAYTVAAKKQVYGIVGIEMMPGPSEIVVLADASGDPRFIAADLLAQAEHGSGMEATICVTTSAKLAQAVQEQVQEQLQQLPAPEKMTAALDTYGAIIIVPDLQSGVDLVNRLAPEHVELMVADPWVCLEGIKNAGAAFLGEASPESVGDYYAGTNHVIPTNGAARYSSALGVADFVKTTSVVAYTQQRLDRVGNSIIRLARAENLEAHAASVQLRMNGQERPE
jgi:histidinol dehydrogenase